MTGSNPTTTKVPAITLGFWLIKIAATTLGETGGDTVSMTLHAGYLLGSAIFLSLLAVFVVLQIAARQFHPFLYWATIVPPPRRARRWRISPTGRWGSAMRGEARCCCCASWRASGHGT